MGTARVAGLTFNPGANTTWESGTWGAQGSGEEHESPRLSGTGLLRILAESIDPAWINTHYTQSEIDAGLADKTQDADGDGLNNLAEFALGRNPRSNDAESQQPDSHIESGSLSYVYRRRRDAATRGLNYDLSNKLDLASSNSWAYVGAAWEIGTNALYAPEQPSRIIVS